MPARLFFEEGSFEPITGRLEIGGASHELRPRTAAVLKCLLAASGRVVTRKELFDTVWHDTIVGDESLAQCIKEIRHALASRADWIRTVPRIGYAFTAEVRGQAPIQQAPSPPSPPSRWQPSRRTAIAASAAVTAVALASLVYGWLARSDPAPFSVVVLPFRSEEPVAHVADAITDALTTDLSRISGSFVIARATAATLQGEHAAPKRVRAELNVRYLLEGAVRSAAPSLQVDARLVDTENGRVVWSDRLQVPTVELEALSLDIVGRLARTLQIQIIDAEAERARRRGPFNATAYDLTMRGWSRWDRHTIEANREARALLEQAVAIDPGAAMAWAGLANTYISDIFLGAGDARDMLPAAQRAANQAYALDPAHANSQGTLATVLAMQGRLRDARPLFESVLQGNPNYAPARMWLAIVLVQLDEPAKGLENVRLARRLSPRDPRVAYFLITEGRALLHLGRHEEAIAVLREAASQPNLGYSAVPLLVAALYLHGREVEARETARAYVAQRPGYRLASWAAWVDQCEAHAKQREAPLLQAAAAAGLPN